MPKLRTEKKILFGPVWMLKTLDFSILKSFMEKLMMLNSFGCGIKYFN